MDNDLEDGELEESDSDQPSISSSANLPPAQKSDCSPWSLPQAVNVNGIRSETRCTTSNATSFPRAARLRRNSSDSESSKEQDEHSSDSDTDNGPTEKRKCTNDNSHVGKTLPAAAGSKSGKNYNIWGTVLQEQSLSKDLSGWFGVNKKVESDRDVETYDYRAARNDSRPTNDDSEQNSAQQAPREDGHFDSPDICEVETFGMVIQKPKPPESQSNDDESDCHQNVLTEDNGKEPVDCRKLLMRKRRFQSSWRKAVDAVESSDSEIDVPIEQRKVRVAVTEPSPVIAKELIRLLGEPEKMTEMFERVVETVGAQKSFELFHATQDVESAGGIQTIDGRRRRTPGGVYLYLLKSDQAITKSQIKKVFIDRYDNQKKIRRAAKKFRVQKSVSAMEVDMSAGKKTDTGVTSARELPECKELYLGLKLERGQDTRRGASGDAGLIGPLNTSPVDISDNNDANLEFDDGVGIELDIG